MLSNEEKALLSLIAKMRVFAMLDKPITVLENNIILLQIGAEFGVLPKSVEIELLKGGKNV